MPPLRPRADRRRHTAPSMFGGPLVAGALALGAAIGTPPAKANPAR